MAKIEKIQFKDAVDNCSEIKDCLKPGLSAMGSDSVIVKVKNPKLLNGSVDIDKAVKPLRPNEARWDYVI